MLQFILKRLLNVPLLLILATLFAFVIIQSGPGNVIDNKTMSANLGPRQVEQYIAEFGLDRPVMVQYVAWLGRAASGHLGRSLSASRPVTEVIGRPIQNSLVLLLSSLAVIYLLSGWIGVHSAVHENGIVDRSLSVLSYLFLGFPSFFLAMLAVYLVLQLKFLTGLTLLPVGGMTSSNFESLSPVAQTFDIAWHAVAPVLCIALIQVAVFSRLLRAQMIDFLAQDYIRTARAKGLAEKTVMYRHALKNALAPFVAGFGALLPALIGGAGLVEIVFNWPGITATMLEAIDFKDFFVFIGLIPIPENSLRNFLP